MGARNSVGSPSLIEEVILQDEGAPEIIDYSALALDLDPPSSVRP